MRIRIIIGALLLSGAAAAGASAQTATRFVGLGDSIGEGVQSADANEATQGFSFLNLVAWRMGAPFPLPFIRTNFFGQVGDTSGRSRVDPAAQSLNLAVSGADVRSLLLDRADALDVSQINSETDLVLFPRTGSQMEIAESLAPEYVACWIGNNDALGAALAFDHLDASQLTPIDEFAADFTQIADRLAAMGSKVAFGTIPDIASIAFLLTPDDLVRLLGSSYGLPDGSLTTLAAAMLIKLGLADPSLLANPNYVLDPLEQQRLTQHIAALNTVIRTVAAAHGMAVADIAAVFDFIRSQPFALAGIPITTRFLGGLFSLDGVHPSDVGQALAAYVFIDALNRQYGASIPQIDDFSFFGLLLTDPFVDKDHDGRVPGRFGAGLLETLLSFLGFSGDFDDQYIPLTGTSAAAADAAPSSGRASAASRALDTYAQQTGRDLRTMSSRERADAMHELFGGRQK